MSAQRPKVQAPSPTILLSPERAAASLDLPYTTFQDKVARREIAYVVSGGGIHRQHRRFLPEDLRAWALHNRVAARWEAETTGEGGDQ